MPTLPQVKTGYLKGVRGLVLTPLNPDGSMPSNRPGTGSRRRSRLRWSG